MIEAKIYSLLKSLITQVGGGAYLYTWWSFAANMRQILSNKWSQRYLWLNEVSAVVHHVDKVSSDLPSSYSGLALKSILSLSPWSSLLWLEEFSFYDPTFLSCLQGSLIPFRICYQVLGLEKKRWYSVPFFFSPLQRSQWLQHFRSQKMYNLYCKNDVERG